MTNTIKKLSVFSLILFSFIFSGGMVFAATEGSIQLQGTVPAILEVTVTTEAGASSLDLSVNVADLLVGTVVERSNKKAGYTVTVESFNGNADGVNSARFKSLDVGNPDFLDYTITYGGTPVVLSGGSALISDVNDKTLGTGTANQVRITYDGSTAFMYEDAYEDTLIFTIAAK